MAIRPVFVPSVSDDSTLVETIDVDFTWYPGFAVSQKQRSIESLHQAAASLGYGPSLEVSTKSPDALGQALSAFNLRVPSSEYGAVRVEQAFQSSKVFERGGPFLDLLTVHPREAKRDPRLLDSGPLIGFRFEGVDWPLHPATAFYDWLYLHALRELDDDITSELIAYHSFTDIEFNPKRSINCQARSCALFVALRRSGILSSALTSQSDFIEALQAGSYPGPQSSETLW